MGSIIAITNQKGGVGKTTTAVNLATGLAGYHGKRVCLVDFDTQCNATFCTGFDAGSVGEIALGQVLDSLAVPSSTTLDIRATLLESGIENLWLLPADKTIPNHLPPHKPGLLRKALTPLKEYFDFVILDTPPSLSSSTTNALVAADWIIVPCEDAILSLEGLADLLETIQDLAELRGELPFRILRTKVDGRLKRSRAFIDEQLAGYTDHVFATKIRTNDALNQAQAARQSIFVYDRASNGAQDYYELINELLAYEQKATQIPEQPAVTQN